MDGLMGEWGVGRSVEGWREIRRQGEREADMCVDGLDEWTDVGIYGWMGSWVSYVDMRVHAHTGITCTYHTYVYIFALLLKHIHIIIINYIHTYIYRWITLIRCHLPSLYT